MKNIISALVAVIFIVGGGIGGHILKGGGSAPASDDGGDKTKKPKGAKPGKKSGHGKDADAGSYGSDVAYFKFTREFVVPVMRDGRVESLIILNINLETDTKLSQKLFSMEPKLRDNIMTTLIGLSSDGTTFESITNVESYETIRAMVLMNLKSVVSSGIQNVLILDMGKQDL